MPEYIERRSNPRYHTIVPRIVRIFNSSHSHRARELNHSNNGIFFENSVDLKSGTIIQIRRENCPKDCTGGKACESCRMTTLATIQWCKKNITEGIPSYSVGAKYFPHSIGY